MRYPILLLFILLNVAAGAQQGAASQDTFSVKADKLGETTADWKANNPRERCLGDKGMAKKRTDDLDFCSYAADSMDPKHYYTYAQINTLLHHGSFYKGQLYKVELKFLHSDSGAILAALTDKYGTPEKTDTLILENRLGIKFDRAVVSWTDGTDTIIFNEFGDDLDTSVVTFTLDKVQKEVTDREKVRAQQKVRADQ